MPQPVSAADAADTASDDFALSDTVSGELPSEGEDPTAEEIEEWANVESPAVASFPSSHSDKDVTEGSPKLGAEKDGVERPAEDLLQEATAVAAQLAATPTPTEDASGSRQIGTPSASAAAAVNSPAAASAAAASTSESWGWAGGWGWQKLREAAAEAAKDVAELKESFQQVLAEVATPDADDEPSPAPPAKPAAVGAATPESEAENLRKREVLQRLEGPDTQLEVGLKAIDDQMEQLATGAAKALNSLWGGLAVVAKGTLTTTTSIATKVENVTLELAKELVQSVEDGVKDASSGLKGVSQLASRAERSLENVGRTALDFLEEAAGQRGGARGAGEDDASFEGAFHGYGGRRAYEELEVLANECSRLCNRTRARLEAGQKAAVDETLLELGPLFDLVAAVDATPTAATAASADSAAAPSSSTPAEGTAAAEGGDKQQQEAQQPSEQQQQQQQDEEQEEQKEQEAKQPAEPTEGSAAAAEESAKEAKAVEAAEGSGAVPASQLAAAGKGAQRRPAKEVEEQLRNEYAPVADLHQAGLRRVEALLEALRVEAAAGAAEKAAAERAAASATADPPQKEAADAAGSSAEAAAGKDATAPEEGKAASSSGGGGGTSSSGTRGGEEPSPATSGTVLVRRMQRETVQCLAELCATELQLLLRLGRSIVAPARYGRPADDGIQWPQAAVAKAVLLHRTARKMAADIEASAEAFIKALSEVEELVAAQLLDEAAAQAAEAAVADLEVDCGTAAARVQEAFRNLLYIVLLSSLHSQGILKA